MAVKGNQISRNLREPVCGASCLRPRPKHTPKTQIQTPKQDGSDVAVQGNRIPGNQYMGVHVKALDPKPEWFGRGRGRKQDFREPAAGGTRLAPKFRISKPNPNPQIPNQDGADVAVEGNRISGNQYVGVHVYGRGSRGLVQVITCRFRAKEEHLRIVWRTFDISSVS